ncbi:MAG TPA: hypothetical protein VFE47_30385 [Tepidisphaeraceae bacterium]|jgi:hypothetical protein|nr:hypothetical protein [Tepidisphaeraceae bacterium]
MKLSADPIIHRQREEQIIQHVEKLLGDERLRVDTIDGRRPVTAYVRDVSRGDRALELKRLMSEMNRPDRELQNQMPVGQILEVALTRTRWFIFPQTVGRVRVVCMSPTRQLIAGQTPAPMTAVEVTKVLASMPPSLGNVPTTVVLVSTSGFEINARELAVRRPDRTVFLVEPNGAGGWSAAGSAESNSIAELFDPENEEQKRQRVRALIEESKLDLLTSGIATDKLAGKAQVPLQLAEAVAKEYARHTPGLSAKRLDGRMVLFRDYSTGTGQSAPNAQVSQAGADFGGSMGLIDKVRTLFARKGENEKKIAFLSERKAALGLQRDRAYEEMSALEQQEAGLKEEFKEAAGAITKRRVTGQMLQLRKDLERRQQLLAVLNQQINVVSTHLHNLELVQQGQTAKLPDTDEITEDAVKAEEMLAQLEADSELAGSVGQVATAGMSEEEKELYAELEREAGHVTEPAVKEPTPKVEAKATEKPVREPAAKTPPVRESRESQSSSPASAPAPSRRAEPEAG